MRHNYTGFRKSFHELIPGPKGSSAGLFHLTRLKKFILFRNSMQLSIIIVNYNVKYFLEQCLYSVEAACEKLQAEIIVVDNASSDGSVEYLEPKFPRVKFIKNEVNPGFAKANNTGLSIAAGDTILFLNPDTILAENTIAGCLDFFEQYADAGAVGVRLIDGGGNFLPESKRAFPSVMASFFKLSGMASLFPRSAIFNQYALGNVDEDAIAEVDVLVGAFLMAPKKILLELTGFDEDYFMYGEDIDLSYRIQKAGYKNFYLGNNAVIHFKGESTQKDKPAYRKNFYEAMKIFVDKHYPKTSSVFLKAAISLGSFISSFKSRTVSSKQTTTNVNFILAGDDTDARSAENILSKLDYQFQKINSLKDFDTTSNLKPQTSNLIFCTGQLSYAECISFVQKNKNKFDYYWHAGGTGSIAGSRAGNATGKIYHV